MPASRKPNKIRIFIGFDQKNYALSTIESRRARSLHRLPTSPPVLHGFGELLGGQRVQHIIFRQPRAAGLQDAVADLFHV